VNGENFTSNFHNGITKPQHPNGPQHTGGSGMDGEAVERLMDVVLQMRINLQHVIVTFQQQTEEIRHQLGAIFNDERKALDDCAARIDTTLRECAAQVEEYKRLYRAANTMRDKLIQLGAEPAEMPTPPLPEQLEESILWRLNQLKC
jgi:hypothetical protein